MNNQFKSSEHLILKLQNSYELQKSTSNTAFFENKVTEQKNKIILDFNYILKPNLTINKGMTFKISHKGILQCVSCQKTVKKLFSGFCFPCLKRKASADTCIMSPHLCHYMNGTCREPEWGESFCYKPHYVYLSYTDKFKVGITRISQIPTRWIDQGATSAKLLAKVTSRHQAGTIENALKEILSDRSHWIKMLKNGNLRPSEEDFNEKYEEVKNWLANFPDFINKKLIVNTPLHLNLSNEIEFFENPPLVEINYDSPGEIASIKSLSLDKNPEIEGKITGIKGQYLFLSNHVFNMRKHEGYIVDIEVLNE
ncbi:DUF2797 domain-containing protein [Fluviispira multicolorata]|uniref:DUF2797 domain-containing protein n=1 Tax=Fluviispira multicolorata TaxID=2654512 RepID=A0A833N7E7_9BACT|nr:DUF2797 domain-containing protein [Fluviispira multicolorata]KAB8032095.1 DUF2797 domain-containing protein [Fluviispira multicolorata]